MLWNPNRIADPMKEREFHNAASDGRDAFCRGVDICPHRAGTAEHTAWWTGWHQMQRSPVEAAARRAATHRSEP